MIGIRPLESQGELEEAVRLQRQIWGFEDRDLLPLRFFVVAQKVGGQVFGAFDGDKMAGFLIAIPGVKAGNISYLHSHMMGVLPEYRNAGLGRQLKLKQREEALARGIDLIEWTFDPLELKNAFFNIERLGAVVRRFVLNQYGTTTSRLHGGLPTDRCVAEWCVRSKHVEDVLDGRKPQTSPLERIEIPNDIGELRTADPAKARQIQQRVAEQFLRAMDGGLAAVGFERGPDTSAYLMEKWPSQ